MLHNKYKKKIINNLIISKFNIKNIFKLPEIKGIEINSTHKNNKLFFFLVTNILLLTANYPKKKIKKSTHNSIQTQLRVNITKKKKIFNLITMLIFLVYSEIPGFKGFQLKNIHNETSNFNYNILPHFFEVNKRVSRKELPLRNKTINFQLNIKFNTKNKNKNIFILKALQFPITVI